MSAPTASRLVRAAQLLAVLAALDLVARGVLACRRGWRWWQDNVPSHNCEEVA